MRTAIAGLVVVLIVLFGSLKTPGFQWKPGVQNPTLTIVRADGGAGETKVVVEIAETETERARGLSGRAALGENEGMLFIFDRAGYHRFWMKEMRFPIDIIWFDNDWRVVDLTANVSPDDFPKIYQPRAPARYVLEVNAGFIVTHQIILMARATLPDGKGDP